jgi:hypothetical protein
MADDRLEWFPCYPSKLLGALSGMKPSEGYVYWIVCLRIYEVGGPCRDTVDALARRTGFNRRIVSEALDACFRAGKLIRDGDGISNPFASEIMADSRSLIEKRKNAGREGGLRASEKRKQIQSEIPSKATAKPQQNGTHLQEQDSLFPNGNRAIAAKPPKAEKPLTKLEIERKELFDRGKEVLGPNAGGMVQKLLAVKHGNVALARAAIEQASTMDNPAQYVGGIVRGGTNGTSNNQSSAARAGFAGLAARVRFGSPDQAERAAPDGLEPINGRRNP